MVSTYDGFRFSRTFDEVAKVRTEHAVVKDQILRARTSASSAFLVG